MTRFRFLFVVFFAACLVPALASARETERFHKVVPLGPGGTLKLSTFSGTVRITGADVSDVTIDAVRHGTPEQLDRIKLDVQVSGSVVTVEANKKDSTWEHRDNNVVETDFEIQVPRQTTLDVNTFSSGVRVAGVTGAQTLHGFSGRLEVQDAPARVRAKTFSGAMDLRFAAGVTEPDVELTTFSGRIDLRLSDAMRAKVQFNTFSGDLRSDLPLTLHRQSRRQLVGELGSGAANVVQVKSFSGDVNITR